MSDERTIIHILEEVDLFRNFTREELGQLLAAGEWSKADAGNRIIVAGELDLFMFILVQGEVQIEYQERVLTVLKPGDTFGEFGIMGQRRTANVKARTPCLFLSFNADRLNWLPVELQIKVLKSILFSLMRRLHKINRRHFGAMYPFFQ